VDTLNAQWSPREVEFIDAFPLTEFGKVDKKQLRALYLARAADTTPRDRGLTARR
jgi:non-ribosomal peptide synthetase component E (peptide arylation enzyme)